MYLRRPNALDEVTIRFNRKVLGQGPGGGPQIHVDFQAWPFNQLNDSDMLDTADLCRLFASSARSVYRWIAEHGLVPSYTVGGQYLFTVEEIRRWYDTSFPALGRPHSR